MPSCYAREAHVFDALWLADNLREEDEAEIRAASGLSPVEALLVGLRCSAVCLTICESPSGEPVGITGVSQEDELLGYPWMLATPKLFAVRSTFIRHSRTIVDLYNSRWPLLANVVDERNDRHLQWLRFCGFHFLARHENYGPESRPFIEFARIQHV